VTGRPGERGAALVVTLVFATAMAGAAVAFLAARRSDGMTIRAQVEAVEVQATLEAALQQTAALIANRTRRQRIPPELRFDFAGAQVRVRIEGEAGKIDLNQAEEPMLRALPLALGLPEDAAGAFADTILDWRDDNQLKRAAGAEDREYGRGERGASAAANRPFAHPAELRYLPPVDRLLWQRLAPLITIYSGSGTPDRYQASPEVRRAVAIARGLTSRDQAAEEAAADAEAGTGSSAEETGSGTGTGSGRGGPGTDASGARGGLAGAEPGGLSASGRSRSSGLSDPDRAGRGGLSASGGSQPTGLSDLDRDGSAMSGRSRRGSADDPAGTEGEDAAEDAETETAAGLHSLVMDVRFANGYQAAARAVIRIADAAAGPDPYLVLDWTPSISDQSGSFIREQSDQP
jgi:general secretion pathway protein K